MFNSIDALIATGAVVLGLSLVVQAIQQIVKQWRDLKSVYMKFQVLAMFNNDLVHLPLPASTTRLMSKALATADNRTKLLVAALEKVLCSFGYKDWDILEQIDTETFVKILQSIDWKSLPAAENAASERTAIEEDAKKWFEMCKSSFQRLYERRMKLWSFMLSAVVVIAMNQNLLDVYREFTANTVVRERALKLAETLTAVPPDSMFAATYDSTLADTVSSESGNDSILVAEINRNLARIQQIVGDNTFQVFRWDTSRLAEYFSPGWSTRWGEAILGWLAMTLLVSLGAPFWYDLLKTVMGFKEHMKTSLPKPEPSQQSASK